MPNPSRVKLQDILITRYIPKSDEIEDQQLETARAGSSTFQPQRPIQNENVIEGGVDDVELVEEEYRTVHRIDETPKLIAKRPALSRNRDEAVKVLSKIRTTPANEIRSETYDFLMQRWFHTTRDSEKELMDYILLHPNHRPFVFTMQCRHLQADDLADAILKSLLSVPRETGQCMARFAIQMTPVMSFASLFSMLETIAVENDGVEISDGLVIATLTENTGNRVIRHRLKTKDCKAYGEIEPELDQEGKLMASSATITCSVTGKRHVNTQIMFKNNSSAKDPTLRTKYIELVQTVKCMNRRVLIEESKNEVVEYEVESEMISLRDGLPPVNDLIAYLKGEDSSDEDED